MREMKQMWTPKHEWAKVRRRGIRRENTRLRLRCLEDPEYENGGGGKSVRRRRRRKRPSGKIVINL